VHNVFGIGLHASTFVLLSAQRTCGSPAPNSTDRQHWGHGARRQNGTTDRLEQAVGCQLQQLVRRRATLLLEMQPADLASCESGTCGPPRRCRLHRTGAGGWCRTPVEVGLPAGKTKPVVVDVLLAATAYSRDRKLSLGKAVQLASLNRLHFMDVLASDLDGITQLRPDSA